MPNGTGMEGHSFMDSEVRTLRDKMRNIEMVLSKVIEACGYEERELRVCALKEAIEIMKAKPK